MQPEIPQLRACGWLVHDELVRRLAQNDLTSMARCEHAGAAIERLPEVVATAQLGLTRVYGDAQLQLHPSRPGRRGNLTLDLERAARSPGCFSEDGEDAVSLAPDLDQRTAVTLDGCADDGIVRDHRLPHGAGPALPEPRRAFEVGEQVGNDPFRQGGHGRHDSNS